MSFINSPNMNLPIPGVGTEAGPNWAFDLNNSLNLIDQHDHSPGRGVQITPAGININAPLNFNNNPALSLSYLSFISQSAISTVAQSISVATASSINELFYTDSNGTQTQITKNGQVNVIASSIPGESYDSGTFFWVQTQSSLPLNPANFSIGSITLQPNVASPTNGVTIIPQNTSAYSLTLFGSLPGSQSFVTVDNTGDLAAPVVFPLVASGIASGTITTTQISTSANILGSQLSASADILGSQLSASADILGSQLDSAAAIIPSQIDSITGGGWISQSTTSGTFSTTTSGTAIALFNSPSLATSNTRPYFISFTDDGNAAAISVSLSIVTGTPTATASFAIQSSNGSGVSTIGLQNLSISSTGTISIPASSLNCIINPASHPGNTQFRLLVSVAITGGTGTISAGVSHTIMQITVV